MSSRGIYGRNLYWRATMQPARMMLWDARLAPLAILTILHFRLWTLILLAVSLAAASLAERRGMTLPAALRALRSALAGPRRRATSRPPRAAADYSCECAGGMVWDPALLRPVRPPLWRIMAERRTAKLASASGESSFRTERGAEGALDFSGGKPHGSAVPLFQEITMLHAKILAAEFFPDGFDGSAWPRGFRAAMDCAATIIERKFLSSRWEFYDGSAIVEHNGFWDFGVHESRLEEAARLAAEYPNDAGADPGYAWPKAHPLMDHQWMEAAR